MSGELRAEPRLHAATARSSRALHRPPRACLHRSADVWPRSIRCRAGRFCLVDDNRPGDLSDAFTVGAVASFLRRRGRAPSGGPAHAGALPGHRQLDGRRGALAGGEFHPRQPAGSLRSARCARSGARAAGSAGSRSTRLPAAATIFTRSHAHIPRTWLFRHRWEAGGTDPKTNQPLQRAEIGGRTTCWSPARQKLR